MEVKPKNTGQFGKGNPGKPKGAINKTTQSAKEAIALAAEKLGGVNRLVEWAKADPANEKAFWSQVYPKLLPLQVSNAEGEAFAMTVKQIIVQGVKPE